MTEKREFKYVEVPEITLCDGKVTGDLRIQPTEGRNVIIVSDGKIIISGDEDDHNN